MNSKENVICICPLDGIIDTIGKKWGLLIINEIGNHGELRFTQIMEELQGISPSTLTTMLKDLAKNDLLKKEIFREIPPRVEYSLTSQGKSLRQAILPILKWATKNGKYTVHCKCSLIEKTNQC